MITSTANSQVKEVVMLQTKAKVRHEAGLFVAEGTRLVSEVPEKYLVKAFYTTESGDNVKALARKIGAEEVAESVFRKMSSTQTPQGILAVARIPEWGLDDVTAGWGANGASVLLLEDIQDPGNLGTIIRTGEGAGIAGIVASRGTADVTNPKVIRGTMGSIFRMPYLVTEDLTEAVVRLKSTGFRIYAAALEGSVPYTEADYTVASAIMIGNEGKGLSAAAVRSADQTVRIPMSGKVESLNAAVAAAVLMYEARRQKQGHI